MANEAPALAASLGHFSERRLSPDCAVSAQPGGCDGREKTGLRRRVSRAPPWLSMRRGAPCAFSCRQM
eukprot:623931-Pyramimonas_sp.AAC.1